MAALRALLQGPAGDLLHYVPVGARTLIVGLAAPDRLPARERVHCVVQRPVRPRNHRRGAQQETEPSLFAARLEELPIGEGQLDALLLVGPLGHPLRPEDVAGLAAYLRDRGVLLLAQPVQSGLRRLVLRAWERAPSPEPAELTKLFLLAGVADIRQERSADGHWIMTRGLFRKR